MPLAPETHRRDPRRRRVCATIHCDLRTLRRAPTVSRRAIGRSAGGGRALGAEAPRFAVLPSRLLNLDLFPTLAHRDKSARPLSLRAGGRRPRAPRPHPAPRPTCGSSRRSAMNPRTSADEPWRRRLVSRARAPRLGRRRVARHEARAAAARARRQGRRHRRTLRRQEADDGDAARLLLQRGLLPQGRGDRRPRRSGHRSSVRHAGGGARRSVDDSDCGRLHARRLRARRNSWTSNTASAAAARYDVILAPSSAGARTTVMMAESSFPLVDATRRPEKNAPPTDRPSVPAAPPATRSPKTTADSSCASRR